MNYIKQINSFWEKAEEHSFGAGEIAMYMYLLHSSNVQAWKNPVIKPNAILQNAVGVQSFNTLTKIRNRLQQTGFIRFKTKNGSQAVEYDLFDVEKQTFSKFEKVVDEVTEKVAAKVTEKVPENTIVFNKHKPKLKQKDVVTSPASSLILEPEEIKQRLIEQEYQLQDFIMRTHGFNEEQYFKIVHLFVDEKTTGANELHKEYTEVLSQFKSYVKYHREKLLKQLNQATNDTRKINEQKPFWRK